MNWILLIIAGLFEVGFATCLGKARETSGQPATLWFVGFFGLPKHQHVPAYTGHPHIAHRYRLRGVDGDWCCGKRLDGHLFL